MAHQTTSLVVAVIMTGHFLLQAVCISADHRSVDSQFSTSSWRHAGKKVPRGFTLALLVLKLGDIYSTVTSNRLNTLRPIPLAALCTPFISSLPFYLVSSPDLSVRIVRERSLHRIAQEFWFVG
jgi:hypothetical protein